MHSVTWKTPTEGNTVWCCRAQCLGPGCQTLDSDTVTCEMRGLEVERLLSVFRVKVLPRS